MKGKGWGFFYIMNIAVYEKQKGICPQCKPPNNHHELKNMYYSME